MRISRKHVVFIILFLIGLTGPLFQSIVYPVFLMKIWCYALFACAFNLLLGYAGLLSFGHAAFLGSAAYFAGNLMMDYGSTWMTPEVAVIIATLWAALLGLVFGWLAIRRHGIYFAMVTLALAQFIYFLALQMPQFTHGEDGLQGVPRGMFLGLFNLAPDSHMYYFVYGVFVIGFWLTYRTIHSPFGQVLRAIRENEPRAVSLGYHVNRYKLLVFVISAALSGMAGATKTLVFQLASLSDVHWHASGEVVLMTLLGGMGTVWGPVVGAAFVVSLQNYLGVVGSWVTVVTGVIFVLCVLVFRRGIVGEIIEVTRRVRKGRQGADAGATPARSSSSP
ncbi:MAG TPA: branched-chain amino acid ABC transporter permease [Burkholderiales bacterium]|jgi:branched-chain amino acid transport system permease protein|nr:branched-chain amino acid ABC transporter permease [Gammaproteobacteria bacterium]HET7633373.1 branched-chain amino acid ABC transporter permease [Burkholderiales bacterium]